MIGEGVWLEGIDDGRELTNADVISHVDANKTIYAMGMSPDGYPSVVAFLRPIAGRIHVNPSALVEGRSHGVANKFRLQCTEDLVGSVYAAAFAAYMTWGSYITTEPRHPTLKQRTP